MGSRLPEAPVAAIPRAMTDARQSELEGVSEEDLEYYRRNPEEARELLSRETVQRRTIGWVVLLAIVLVTASKLAGYYLRDVLGEFVVEVVVDLVFETGAALMGAVATLLFVEIAQARQYAENKRLYRAVQAQLKAEEEAEEAAT